MRIWYRQFFTLSVTGEVVAEHKYSFDDVARILREHEKARPGISQSDFERLSGISNWEWQDASELTRFDELRVKVGLPSNKSDLDLEKGLAQVCQFILRRRAQGKLQRPSLEDLEFERRNGRLDIPGRSTLAGGETKSRKPKSSIKWTNGRKIDGFWEVVGDFARRHSEFSEVAASLGHVNASVEGVRDEDEVTATDLLGRDDFVPPIVRNLPALATIDAGSNPTKVAKEFEQRVGHAFKAMGLDVEYLGGPKEADGIVRAPRGTADEDWAIVYDAKRYIEGYQLNTADERALKDYARKHGVALREEGFKVRYFVYIAPRFGERDRKRVEDLKNDLGDDVQHVVFLEVDALVRMVERRLSEGRKEFSNKDIGRILRKGTVRLVDVG